MVEYLINKEMATAKSDLVLTANKGKSLPQLQKEGLKIIDYLAFQIAFLLWKIQKLQYIGIFNNILSTLYILTFGSQCDNALLVFTESQAMEEHTITLSSQLAYTPILLCTLSSVESNLQWVVPFENFNIVAPTQ